MLIQIKMKNIHYQSIFYKKIKKFYPKNDISAQIVSIQVFQLNN
jgi:hypothetical protein